MINPQTIDPQVLKEVVANKARARGGELASRQVESVIEVLA